MLRGFKFQQLFKVRTIDINNIISFIQVILENAVNFKFKFTIYYYLNYINYVDEILNFKVFHFNWPLKLFFG
jgi:hypothetical protein